MSDARHFHFKSRQRELPIRLHKANYVTGVGQFVLFGVPLQGPDYWLETQGS